MTNSFAVEFSSPQPLSRSDVHVWILDCSALDRGCLDEAMLVMSPQEKSRAQSLVRGREDYISSRLLMRRVLSNYAGVSPKLLEFACTDRGKPYIVGGSFQFNLSHSGRFVVLAVSFNQFLGVDIEAIRELPDIDIIAKDCLHLHEFSIFKKLDGKEKLDYFYCLWTLKESIFKALGAGVTEGLHKVFFNLQENNIFVKFDPDYIVDNHNWNFYQRRLAEEYAFSLAVADCAPTSVRWMCANQFLSI